MGKNGDKRNDENGSLPFAGFMTLSGSLGDAMKRGQESFETGMKAFQEESLDFLRRRLEHTTECVEQHQGNGGLADMFAIQQKWMADFAHDWYDESVRMGSLMQKMMQQAAGATEGQEERSGKDH